MISPGTYTLAALSITTALSGQVQTPITGLEGMLSANILFELIGASGGTSVSVTVRTSRDDGTTWLDVARFDTTIAVKKYANLQRSAAKAVTSYSALSGEGVNDTLFGPMWDAVVTSVGTFANTTLRVTLDAA